MDLGADSGKPDGVWDDGVNSRTLDPDGIVAAQRRERLCIRCPSHSIRACEVDPVGPDPDLRRGPGRLDLG